MKKTSPRLVEEIKHPALLDYIRNKKSLRKNNRIFRERFQSGDFYWWSLKMVVWFVCEKILVTCCCHSLLGCEETHPRRTVDGPLRAVVTQDGGIQKERRGRLLRRFSGAPKKPRPWNTWMKIPIPTGPTRVFVGFFIAGVQDLICN